MTIQNTFLVSNSPMRGFQMSSHLVSEERAREMRN